VTESGRDGVGETPVTSENRDPAGADRVTVLERSFRLLLRAYPAGYRRGRGEEMLGTLLEATPPGRTWPRVRDARALIAGGLTARAAQNRSLSTAANLRIAVLAGVSMCLVMIAADYLSPWVIDPGSLRYEWRDVALGLLIVVAVLPVWIAPRKMAALSGLTAAVAIYFLGRDQVPFRSWIWLMVCVAAMVLLAPRSARAPRTWLWLIGGFAVAVLASSYGSAGLWPQVAPPLALGVVSVAWIAVDARLAVAVTTFVLTFYVERTAPFFNAGMLPFVLATVTIAALPVWLLRRQSERRGRPS
jgi:hypothetical protein